MDIQGAIKCYEISGFAVKCQMFPEQNYDIAPVRKSDR